MLEKVLKKNIINIINNKKINIKINNSFYHSLSSSISEQPLQIGLHTVSQVEEFPLTNLPLYFELISL